MLENNKLKQIEIENRSLSEKVNKIINILENKTEVNTTTESDIDKITEAINKLNIGDIKLKRKPTPYTHWLPRK